MRRGPPIPSLSSQIFFVCGISNFWFFWLLDKHILDLDLTFLFVVVIGVCLFILGGGVVMSLGDDVVDSVARLITGDPDVFSDFVMESSLSRVFQHVDGGSTIGAMSVFRSDVAGAVNEANHAMFRREIRQAGFGYIPLLGHYEETVNGSLQEVVEPSFLIISNKDDSGRLKGFLKIMGRKYNQESVLYKDSGSDVAVLIFMSDFSEVVLGPWSPFALGKYYSEIGAGRGFHFKVLDEAKVSKFPLGWSLRG